jgi:hypothetical protein
MTLKTFYSFLFLFALKSFCQNNEYINSDRPDQSEATYILTKNALQLENGAFVQNRIWMNNLMVRFGLSKKTEIRFVADIETAIFTNSVIGLSFKHKLFEQKNIIPEVTIVGYYRNLIKNKIEFHNQENYALILAFQNTLSDKFTIGYNFGSTALGQSYITTFFTNFMLSKKISLYAEYFSFVYKNNSPSYNFDVVVFYVLNPSLQLDLAYGQTIDKIPNNYLSFGVSYKIDRKKEK